MTSSAGKHKPVPADRGWYQPKSLSSRANAGPSAPPIKGSPLPLSARQRLTSKPGEPGPDPWRGADHGGACGSGADQEHSESDGSEDPEGLRPALHLELQRPLLGRGERHQAARAHGMGTGIKEPDPCPGRIEPWRVVLDAYRADRGIGGGDGRIRRGQPYQAPARGNQRQALPTGPSPSPNYPVGTHGTHRGEPQRGTNTAEDSSPAAANADRSFSNSASCSSWASLSC